MERWKLGQVGNLLDISEEKKLQKTKTKTTTWNGDDESLVSLDISNTGYYGLHNMEEVNVVDTNTCREEPGRLQIGRTGVTISKVGPEDAGTYTCR